MGTVVSYVMRSLERLVNLLLICAGFAAALLIYNTFFLGGLTPFDTVVGSGTSVLAFWVAMELKNGGGHAAVASSWWVSFIEQFCLGTGVNLLLHAILTYAFFIRRTPFLVASGGLFAAALLTLNARWKARRRQAKARVLLVGFDNITERVVASVRRSLCGVIAEEPGMAPAGIPYLGNMSALGEVLKKYRPSTIIVSTKDWSSRVPPAVLLNCRMGGIDVADSPAVYEKVFSRVCCERLQPVDLLLSSALRGDSRTMAIQSVYTNLIGLFLLVLLSPLILLIAIFVLFSGAGPVFENFECAGFQYIPFRLLRFRTTRHDGTGTMTAAGRWIARLHMANLPQLLNVVRGDMALVGPKPVRSEFARYLTAAMPFYSHRFSVKPGIIGWAQLHARSLGAIVPDECRQVEYDLFYVKEGSLWMDIEIVLAAAGPIAKSKERGAGVAAPQGAGL